MKKTATFISIVSLSCLQAGIVSASPPSSRTDAKTAIASCDAGRSTRSVKKVRLINACQNDATQHTAAYVFAGGLVAGAVAIGVSTTNHHTSTASP